MPFCTIDFSLVSFFVFYLVEYDIKKNFDLSHELLVHVKMFSQKNFLGKEPLCEPLSLGRRRRKGLHMY